MSVDRGRRSQPNSSRDNHRSNLQASTPESCSVEYDDHSFRYRTPQRAVSQFPRSVSPIMAERRTYVSAHTRNTPTHSSAHLFPRTDMSHPSPSNGDWRATAGHLSRDSHNLPLGPHSPAAARPQVKVEGAHNSLPLRPASRANDSGRQSDYIPV